jgi:hypothetical protein
VGILLIVILEQHMTTPAAFASSGSFVSLASSVKIEMIE